MFKFIILLITLIPALALAQTVTSCGGVGTPTQVRIKGCSTSICTVKSGTTIDIEIDFVAPIPATYVVPTARVGFGLFFIDVDMNISNACPLLTRAQCPLATHDASTLNLSIPVDATYPHTQLPVELTLRDQAKTAMVCALVTFNIIG